MYFMGDPPILSGYFLCYRLHYIGKSRFGQSEKSRFVCSVVGYIFYSARVGCHPAKGRVMRESMRLDDKMRKKTVLVAFFVSISLQHNNTSFMLQTDSALSVIPGSRKNSS